MLFKKVFFIIGGSPKYCGAGHFWSTW